MLKKVYSNTLAYDDHDYIGPFCIKLPKMIGYATCFDNNKTMSFKVTDNNSLEKFMEKSKQLNEY